MTGGPFDYAGMMGAARNLVPDLAAQNAQRRLIALQESQLAQQVRAADAQLASRAAFQSDLNQILLHPTPEGYSKLILKHPEYARQVKDAHGLLDEQRQRSDLRQLSEVYSAAANGRYDLAAASLQGRITADKAAGGDVDAMDQAILDALKSGDPIQQRAALGQMGTVLAALTGPDKFAATFGALTEQSGDYTLSPGQQRRDRFSNEIIASAPFAPRPITVGEGQTVVEYQPGGGDQPSSGGGVATGTPRGVRNSNPGNLRDGPFAKAQPGYTGRDADGFAIFTDEASGLAAQTKLLSNRYIGRGINTARRIVARYAPASENSPASMANYAGHIAARLGIGVDDPISKEQAGALAKAMGEFENGTWQQSGPRVIARGAPKTRNEPTPSQTRVVGGRIYVKIRGQWYQKAG